MSEPSAKTGSTGQAPDPGGTARRERRRRQQPLVQLTLLRHAEPEWNPGGERRVGDPELTGFGRAQADATAAALARERIDAIYVSPTRRSRATAAPLAAETGLDPVIVEDLAEIRVGGAGMSLEDVDAYFEELARRPLEEHWSGWPGAEPFRAFHERALGALESVLAAQGLRPREEEAFRVWDVEGERPRHLVLVAHGGTNAVLITHLLGVAAVPWEWLRFECELSAYAVLQARPLGAGGGCVFSLVNFNELDHLRAAGLR